MRHSARPAVRPCPFPHSSVHRVVTDVRRCRPLEARLELQCPPPPPGRVLSVADPPGRWADSSVVGVPGGRAVLLPVFLSILSLAGPACLGCGFASLSSHQGGVTTTYIHIRYSTPPPPLSRQWLFFVTRIRWCHFSAISREAGSIAYKTGHPVHPLSSPAPRSPRPRLTRRTRLIATRSAGTRSRRKTTRKGVWDIGRT